MSSSFRVDCIENDDHCIEVVNSLVCSEDGWDGSLSLTCIDSIDTITVRLDHDEAMRMAYNILEECGVTYHEIEK